MLPAPNSHPAEVVDISPEALEVANYYLQVQDTDKVAEDLGISKDLVIQMLGKREVKAYVDHVFMDLGFNNRYKLRAALDAVISKKFQDMDDSDTGSSKDIADLLALSHKFTMEHLNAQIKLEELKQKNQIKSQVNVQINENGSNYGNLIERLITNNV